MARQKGSLSLSSNIEVAAAAPLDARLIVPTKSDLTASGNFPYSYVGMIVSVLSEGKAYMLSEAGTTDLSHWKEIGSDGAAAFPTGGTTGQALVKASNTDNDVEWENVVLASEKGSASGIAELDANGKVPASQLPSYVDDVIDGYLYEGKFYEEDTHTTEITPETGKIYVDLDTGKTYRWSGGASGGGVTLTVGNDYTMGDFTWTCAEDLGGGVYAMQSQGMTSGTWPGYKLTTDYTGTEDFGNADTSYNQDIDGINIANYDTITTAFYDTANWKSVCADNKGLYLVSYTKVGAIEQVGSGNYYDALKEATVNTNKLAWIGNVGTSTGAAWFVSTNGRLFAGTPQSNADAVLAPAFDIDSSKIELDPSTSTITIASGSSGMYVEISESLALGETSSTAYAGNKGKQNADNISDLQTLTSKLKASIAYVEDGNTATAAHSEGDLVLFKGELTKASSVISIGDTLAIGTNLTVTTLEDEIAAGGSGGGALETALNVSMTTGGIQSGTTYAAGTSCDRLWHELLDPTQYPTLTAPSATLSATGAKLLETGATLATTMTIALNRGSISPAYGTSGYRAGEAVSYTLADGASQSSNSFSVTITSDKTSYQGSVSYAAGEQPKDSHGGNYSTPLDAGSVNTNTLTYEFVDALWSNDSSIGTIAKEALVSKSAKQKQFDFPAATVSNPEVFDVPASWTVSAVEVLNTLSNKWESAASQFSITDTTHNDAAGNSVAYKRYTCNLGYDMGARSIRVKWS